jgi:sigma-54 dependent transcriptional regulator, flagellar regulatory protein
MTILGAGPLMTNLGTPARDGAATVDTLLLGTGPTMTAIRALVRRVAPGGTSVLVTGPSGSGKERVARAIHAESDRANGPFVAINCGAIPRDLLESELFGHEKGSFTGAHAQRQGRFEEAHKGTLFLDEIGDMPPDMQVKLLRVLEERRIERVGGRGSIAVDVRIVSATHRNLSVAIEDQRFREDLYYRLAVFPIHLPGLAARPEDLPILVRHFLKGLGSSADVRFSDAGIAALSAHNWPGNVRELRNFVERAAILHSGETLGPDAVAALLLRPSAAIVPIEPKPAPAETVRPAEAPFEQDGIDLRAIMHDIEGRYIGEALSRSNGVVADAARLLGLQRTTLIEKMRRHAA